MKKSLTSLDDSPTTCDSVLVHDKQLIPRYAQSSPFSEDKPTLNPSHERFLNRNIHWQNKRKLSLNRVQKEAADSQTKECTFKPQINAKSTKMVQVMEERVLSSDASLVSLAEEDFQKSLKDSLSFKKVMGETEIEQFLERQQEYDFKRKLKVTLVSDSQVPKFQPTLCQNSLAIVDGQPNQCNFKQRNKKLLRKKITLQQSSLNSKQYTFKPEISPHAQTKTPMTPHDLCYEDPLRRKLQKQQSLMDKENQISRTLTFKPQLFPESQKVPARFNLQNIVEEAKRELHQRQHLQALEKARRSKEEEQLCTFKPQINKAPEYMREIATEYRAFKDAQGPQPLYDYVPWRY